MRENTGSTSLTIPNAGKIRMYTSGCPKIQNRCCHSNGSAPASTVKNVASKLRCNVNNTSATVMTGMANNSKKLVTMIIQLNVGTRIIDMPLVRMLRTVTIRLMAPVREAMPVICKPSATGRCRWSGRRQHSSWGRT